MSTSAEDRRIAFLLTSTVEEDKGEYYADLFSGKELVTKDLLLFHDWLCLGDVDQEVSSFL